MDFADTIDLAGKAVDVAGVVIILAGMLLALLFASMRRTGGYDGYRSFRLALGRAILLGLEVLVAADIIRTVAAEPTLQQVGVLAIIVAIRTFLSMTLELEITGRWLWQAHREAT